MEQLYICQVYNTEDEKWHDIFDRANLISCRPSTIKEIFNVIVDNEIRRFSNELNAMRYVLKKITWAIEGTTCKFRIGTSLEEGMEPTDYQLIAWK